MRKNERGVIEMLDTESLMLLVIFCGRWMQQ